MSTSNRPPIYLLGYMGSGKSTLGRELHRLTGTRFVDLDKLIESRYKMSISDIFSSMGESGFRRIESETMRHTADMSGSIIALGGGTPCHDDNMDWLLAHGTTIYLEASVDKLYQRLLRGRYKRPLIANLDDTSLLTHIRTTLATRLPYYSRAMATFNADALDLEREETARRFAAQFGINNTDNQQPYND